MTFPNKIIRNSKTGQEIRFLQSGPETKGQLLHLQTTYQPHSREPAAHYHPYQTEDFKVLAGEINVRIGKEVKILKKGDGLHLPANTIHAKWNAAEQAAVVDWQIRPALNTATFFETTTGLANAGKTNAVGMPSIWQVALLATHFANVFRLAKPPFMLQRVVFGLLTPIAYLLGYRPTYPEYLD
ncbi:cupin domain-containing protein [Adhaeribacter pallidiroseus]|uniref:Cupin type-2 domain-containing protein n=1 Tax=Adhaeribacter pallidiroseus TaxID=2072847 RepID=A0A369QQG4_9BACT|nr:cupin domain-containing protein [Adhaeribacter pallidiroseus]RDC65526.1 hypothetical protein AHMF7616_04156 [Adhaeribacter pallidiroseus]